MKNNQDDAPVMCALRRCGEEVGTFRKKRGYVTCSAEHGRALSLDQMAKARAKKIGCEVLECVECFKLFTDRKKKGYTTCSRCRGVNSKPLGRKANYNYDPVGLGDMGIFHKDFRTTICRKNGIQCANYSACSDSVVESKHGAFEYQINGGVSCYVHPSNTAKRVNYGNSFSVCSVNHG